MDKFVYPEDPIIVGVEYTEKWSGKYIQSRTNVKIKVWENALTPSHVPLMERPWHLANEWKSNNPGSTKKRDVAIISISTYNKLKDTPTALAEHIIYIVEQAEWRSPKVLLDG